MPVPPHIPAGRLVSCSVGARETPSVILPLVGLVVVAWFFLSFIDNVPEDTPCFLLWFLGGFGVLFTCAPLGFLIMALRARLLLRHLGRAAVVGGSCVFEPGDRLDVDIRIPVMRRGEVLSATVSLDRLRPRISEGATRTAHAVWTPERCATLDATAGVRWTDSGLEITARLGVPPDVEPTVCGHRAFNAVLELRLAGVWPTYRAAFLVEVCSGGAPARDGVEEAYDGKVVEGRASEVRAFGSWRQRTAGPP